MSNDVVEKNGLSLPEIEKILQRKDSNKKVPPQLRPQALHQLYKDIKLPHYKDPHKLKRFQRWEEEVSKRIAEHYLYYKQEFFDIKKLKHKRDGTEGRIHHKARALKAKVSSRKIDKVRDYFKNTSHAWLIDYVSFRKKDFDSFRDVLYSYNPSKKYLKITHGVACKKARMKFYEKRGGECWENTLEETNGLKKAEAHKKFCEEFGEEYWEEIHEPYLEEIREAKKDATNVEERKKFCEIFDENNWVAIHKEYLKKIHETTKKKAGKKFRESYDNKHWKVPYEDLLDRFRAELEEFFPSIYLSQRKPRKGPYISDNEFVMKEYGVDRKSRIKELMQMLHIGMNISNSEYDLVYPFLNINRLVLYFWLEQTKPILSPEMILSEIRKEKNIGKYELDVFLIWLWEVVDNLDEYNNDETKNDVKEQIIKLLADLYYQVSGKEPFKDKNTIKRQWKQYRWMKNNAKNARLKPLLDDYSIKQYKLLRTKYNLPDRKRLDNIISKQSKS